MRKERRLLTLGAETASRFGFLGLESHRDDKDVVGTNVRGVGEVARKFIAVIMPDAAVVASMAGELRKDWIPDCCSNCCRPTKLGHLRRVYVCKMSKYATCFYQCIRGP